MILAPLPLSEIDTSTTSSVAAPTTSSGAAEFGLTVMMGVPLVTMACTVWDPIQQLWDFTPEDKQIKQLADQITQRTWPFTKLLDCGVLGLTSQIPGVNKMIGAPSYPGLYGGPAFAKWLFNQGKNATRFPELGPLLTNASPAASKILIPLAVGDGLAQADQCYNDPNVGSQTGAKL